MGIFETATKDAILTAGRSLEWSNISALLVASNSAPTAASDGIDLGDADAVRLVIAAAGNFTSITYEVWVYYDNSSGPASISAANGWCRMADESKVGITGNISHVVNIAGARRIYIHLTSLTGTNAQFFAGKAIVT